MMTDEEIITQQQQTIEETHEAMEQMRAEMETIRIREAESTRLNQELQTQLQQAIQQMNQLRRSQIDNRGNQNVLREQNNVNNRQGGNNNNEDMMRAFLEYLQGAKINVEMPTFRGENKCNPIEFLDKLDKYFDKKRILQDQKILIVEDCLKGRALLWFTAKQPPFRQYRDFEREFRLEFCCIERRWHARWEWDSRTYSNGDKSLYEFFQEQVKEARYCLPDTNQTEINYLILKQLPNRVQENLVTIQIQDRAAIEGALKRLDQSRSDNFQRYNKRSNYSNATTANNIEKPQSSRTNQTSENKESQRPGSATNTQYNNNAPYNNNAANKRWSGNNQNNKQVRQIQKSPASEGNWRLRDNPEDENETNQETSRASNHDDFYVPSDEHATPSEEAQIRMIRTSDFDDELCWDIAQPNTQIIEEESWRIVSPRILSTVNDNKVAILVDTGSEITCISEAFYLELRQMKKKMVELPVSNLTVWLAIGKKRTTIKKQVQLSVKVGDLEIENIFLVVPGLSTKVLYGMDWVYQSACVIDLENKKMRVMGYDLPEELVLYKAKKKDNAARCAVILLDESYDQFVKEVHVRKLEIDEDQLYEQKGSQETNVLEIPQDINKISLIKNKLAEMNYLNDEQKQKFGDLLSEYWNIFSEKPGLMRGYEHPIVVNNSKKIIRKSYPVPLKQRAAVDKEIGRMLEWGVIELSNSPFCNPLRIVEKANGDVRVCLDARFINEIIEGDNEAPPLIDELLQHFHGCEFLSSTDMTKGYWQIPLTESSRKYTAFLHNGTLYHFRVIPFGLSTAGAGFVRGTKINLGPEILSFVTAYIDDFLIPSASFDAHLEHLSRLFRRVREVGATLSLRKSTFFQIEVSMLGFLVNRRGVSPDPERLEAIREFPRPCDRRQLQGFLGVCGYYRRFVMKHSDYIVPFRELLQADSPWRWTENHTIAFQKLKENFLRAVTICHYIPDGRFFLQCDASDSGISGVLFQYDDQGDQRIVSITSRVLTKSEINWTTTEKELCAIIYSLLKFRMFLYGQEFDIITDHQALTFIKSTPYYNMRLLRWMLFLQQYRFRIVHCKGKNNIVADFFSRNFGSGTIRKENQYMLRELSRSISMITLEFPELQDTAALQRDQSQDDNIKKLKSSKEGKLLLQMDNGIIYGKMNDSQRWVIVLPSTWVKTIVTGVHVQYGHPGIFKTFEQLKRFFFWKYMRRDVKNIIRSCDLCQRVKYGTRRMEGVFHMVEASRPNELLAVDFYGPMPKSRGGVQYLFVCLDVFSKYVTLYAIKHATAEICVNKLKNEQFSKVGKPERILADHGTQFTSRLWSETLEAAGIKVVFSSIRHPQSNPSERCMKELGRFFRSLCSHSHGGWALHVGYVQDCILFGPSEHRVFPLSSAFWRGSTGKHLQSVSTFKTARPGPKFVD